MTFFPTTRTALDTYAKPLGVTYQTLNRWATAGLRVNGETVKLRSVKVGGRRYTTDEDVKAFLKLLNPGLVQGEPVAAGAGAGTGRELAGVGAA